MALDAGGVVSDDVVGIIVALVYFGGQIFRENFYKFI
jgi:hypothetical protein